MQAPFIAARLAELAARKGAVTALSFRATAPCFVDQPIRLAVSGEEHHAIRCDGAIASIVKADYQ
ncbi:hypothetical protein AB5I41_14640 [Sphingomonas sp. MMS24-JH45]